MIAARWLPRDLEYTVTLHRPGLYELLGPRLRASRPLVRASYRLFKQRRGLRHGLPPQERCARMALLPNVIASRMRRLAHASQLLPMRSALFADEASVPQS